MTAPLPLGRVVATPGALKLLGKSGKHPFNLLARHATGDWGELCARVWIITEADRSVTTILLPEDY